MPIRVSTLVGESVIVEKVYRSCFVTFIGSNTHVDLVILEMVDFDVILGMTWLSPNFAILDCNAKTVTLAKPGTDPLVWEGDYTSTPVRIISFLRAKRMVSKGCLAFLAHLRDDTSQVPSIESVSIVREFLDMFLQTFLVCHRIGILIFVLIWSRALAPFPYLLIGWLQQS